MPHDKPKKKRITVYLDDQTAANLAAFNRLVYSEPYGANTYTVNAALQYYIQNSPYVEHGRMSFVPTDPTELVYDTKENASITAIKPKTLYIMSDSAVSITDNISGTTTSGGYGTVTTDSSIDGTWSTTDSYKPKYEYTTSDVTDTYILTASGDIEYLDEDIVITSTDEDELVFKSEATIVDGVITADILIVDTIVVRKMYHQQDDGEIKDFVEEVE